jgi:2-iminobutanoate/2-iminopropanoate deaminase
MSDRKTVHTPGAPRAIGPYSQAVVSGGLVFTAGQVALDPQGPSTGALVGGGDAAAETERCLKNLEAVLVAAGSGLDRVLRCEVYLADLGDFAAMNEAYGRFFPGAPPARVTVEVSRLPKDARVEISAVASVG